MRNISIENVLWVSVSFGKCSFTMVYKRTQKLYGQNSILYIFLSDLIFHRVRNLRGLPPLFQFKSYKTAVPWVGQR